MDLSTKIGWLLVHLAKLDVGLLWEAKKFLWQGWAMGGRAHVWVPLCKQCLPSLMPGREETMHGGGLKLGPTAMLTVWLVRELSEPPRSEGRRSVTWLKSRRTAQG